MNGWLRSAIVVLLLLFAAILKPLVEPQMAILGARPDFLLLIGLLTGLRTRPSAGALAGALAGLLSGGLAGAGIGAYVASRSIAGFSVGWIPLWNIELSAVRNGATVGLATLLGQGLFVLVAAPSDSRSYLAATIGTAVYNGVIAIPLDALLRRVFDRKVD